jgi:hypothetical protein
MQHLFQLVRLGLYFKGLIGILEWTGLVFDRDDNGNEEGDEY